MPVDWIALGSRLALVDARRRARARQSPQVRRIRVKGAYEPAQVHVTAGQPVQLIFRREETARCSERVVFPGLGISAELLPHRDVTVELASCPPGVHPFRCQMDVLHGELIAEERRAEPKEAR